MLLYADAAVVSGLVWQSLPAADRELITKTVKTTLDALTRPPRLALLPHEKAEVEAGESAENRPMLPNVGLKAAKRPIWPPSPSRSMPRPRG